MKNIIHMSTINHIYLSALVDFKIRPTTHQMNNIEWSCDLVNLAHDVGQSATSWRQAQQQLITHEEKFFTDYRALHGQSTSTTKPVDVDQVLGTSGVSGLQCPKCGSYDSSYTLYARCRGDEGMKTYCVCRKCGKRWVMGV